MLRTTLTFLLPLPLLLSACSSGMGGVDPTASGDPSAGDTGGTSDTGGSTGGSTGDDGSGSGGSTAGTGDADTGTAGGVCGDGNLDPGEACDDGNTLDGDGCQADCTLPEPGCGDGTAEPGEFCHAPETVADLQDAPTGIAAADLDGDGRDDLVVAVASKHEVRRYFLDADGTAIEDEAAFPAGTSPRLLRLLDADSNPGRELFVQREPNGTWGLSALPGNPDGTFGSVVEIAPYGIYDYDAGHHDLDGAPDLLVSGDVSVGGPLLMLFGMLDLGNPNLQGQIAGGIFVGDDIPFFCMADLDGDGREDVSFVTTDEMAGTSDLWVARSNPPANNGTADGYDLPQVVGTFPEATGMTCRDLDGDGLEDLVVAHGDGSLTTALMSDALAVDKFAYYQPASAAATAALTTGDLDGDGGIEVVVVDEDGGVHVLDQIAPGELEEAHAVNLPEVPAQIAVADAGSDGVEDVYYVLEAARRVGVLRSRP